MSVAPSRSLRITDRWFRIVGAGTLAMLALTGGMLVAGVDTWWVPFVGAHLLALVALLPLAFVLLIEAGRASGGPAAMVRRHPLPAALVTALAVTVALSLMNFEGNRDVRRFANFSSVAIILLLVVRYLRWSRAPAR